MLNDSFDAVLDEGANSSTSNSACSSEEKPKKDWMKPNVVGKSTPPPPDSDEENSASDSDDDGLFTLGKKIAHKKPISAGPQPFSLGMLASLLLKYLLISAS